MESRKYDLYLSYNPLDAEAVQSLASDLNAAGINVWFDQWKLVPGQKWSALLDQAMSQSAAVAICIGARGTKEWFQRDLSLALSIQQRDPAFKIIPILIPEAEPTDIPTVMSRMQFLDLRNFSESETAIRALKTRIQDAPLISSTFSYQRQFSLASSTTFIPQPPANRFVARKDATGRDLIERLQEELAPGRNQLVTLSGAGGVGKTTLAVMAAVSLSEPFKQRIVWANLQERDDFSLSTMLDAIATQLGRADLRPLDVDIKSERVREIAMVAPTLVVLDNFETISPTEAEKCINWLTTPAICTSLVTTRQVIDSGTNIVVGRMLREEAHEFLRLLIAEASSETVLDYDQLVDAADANPLVMQWLVAQIDLAGDPHKVLQDLKSGEGSAARIVFDRSFDLPQISETARNMLLGLCLFVPSATRQALAAMAGLTDKKTRSRVSEDIRILTSLSLIKVIEGEQRLTIEGLTRELAKARLSTDTARLRDLESRFVSYFAETLRKQHATLDDLDALEADKDNVLAAIDIAVGRTDWNSVIRFMRDTALPLLLDYRGYWDEAIKYGEQAVVAAKATQEFSLAADFSNGLAIMKTRRGEYDEAKDLYNQALSQYRQAKNETGVAMVLHQLGLIAQNQGDLDEAERLYKDSLEIVARSKSERGMATVLHQLGTIARRRGDTHRARELYEQSLEIEKKLDYPRSMALTIWGLGNVALMEEHLEDAKNRFQTSLEIFRKLGDQVNIAGVMYQMGMLEEHQGNRLEAIRLIREGLDIFERLKSPQVGLARKVLDDLGESD